MNIIISKEVFDKMTALIMELPAKSSYALLKEIEKSARFDGPLPEAPEAPEAPKAE